MRTKLEAMEKLMSESTITSGSIQPYKVNKRTKGAIYDADIIFCVMV